MNEFELFLAQMKAEYGPIYLADIEGESYFFRLLTRKEYTDTLKLSSNKELQDELFCQLAVVYPTELNFAQGDAGVPTTLAPHIVFNSGFASQDKPMEMMEYYRNEMRVNFERQAEGMIQAAFPQIREEEMQEWTVPELMRTTAKAEWVLQEIHGYPIGFQKLSDIVSDEEEQEEPEEYTLKELGMLMRQEGKDPMVEYAPYIQGQRPYAELPFIGGIDYWKRGGV